MTILRNLNQVTASKRVCGTPHSGVNGALIPASGDNGAGFAYASLSLPADNAKEICGRITTWPSAGVLKAFEDTSFTFTGAPDGTYSFIWQLVVNGVNVGAPATTNLTVGGVTISALVGNAAAAGLLASVANTQTITINGLVGNAAAAGLLAAIANAQTVTINGLVGNAAAAGLLASVTNAQTVSINGLVGNAAAAGLLAAIANVQTVTINGLVGNASAAGLLATITNPSMATISCLVGNAIAIGLTASLTNGAFARAPTGSGYRRRRERSVRL